MKTFLVNGVRVTIWIGGMVGILTISRSKADLIKKYLRAEGLIGEPPYERNDKKLVGV